jgi:sigma-E factor negative regulatory protein RseC
MASEEGIVTQVSGLSAVVRTVKSGDCEACSAKGFCSDAGREMNVSALNSANARPGDRVRVEIPTGAFIKAMFLLYIFPVLALLAGALVGLSLGGDHSAALGALIGFVLSVLVVRHRGRRMGAMAAYQPRIVKVLQRAATEDVRPDAP